MHFSKLRQRLLFSSMKFKRLVPVLLIVLVIFVIVLDQQRRAAEAEVQQLSLKLGQQGDSAQNQAQANEIIAKVKQHMDLDTSVQPTVATIVDVDKLRQQNSFYNQAKNGDFLIVTPTRAILYDEQADKVIDVVPVQIQDASASSASSAQ